MLIKIKTQLTQYTNLINSVADDTMIINAKVIIIPDTPDKNCKVANMGSCKKSRIRHLENVKTINRNNQNVSI